jgi:hypothetical protein
MGQATPRDYFTSFGFVFGRTEVVEVTIFGCCKCMFIVRITIIIVICMRDYRRGFD